MSSPVVNFLGSEAEQKVISTIISTGDKDLSQLVTKNIKLVNTMKNEFLDGIIQILIKFLYLNPNYQKLLAKQEVGIFFSLLI